MKIIAWNVNGLKSLLKTDNLNNLVNIQNPDILCMGETKLPCIIDDMDIIIKNKFPEFNYRYWSPCIKRPGYSGTCILSKIKALKVINGINYKNKQIDNEGRVITIELDNFYLIHVYTPNSGQALERLEWRTKIWDRAFEKHINKYQKKKPVIVCGDLNVAHNEIDLKNPKTNTNTAGFTIEERNSFNELLKNTNLIDTFRELNPNKIEYSYWSYMRKSRERNIGWRIDYFLVSEKIKNNIKKSIILTDIMGSDHAPIKLKLNM
jgi:exodeoxyribonuclease III